MNRYSLNDVGQLEHEHSSLGQYAKFSDVQQLVRDVLPRIAHKEECSLVADYHSPCDCGFVELKAKIQRIADSE